MRLGAAACLTQMLVVGDFTTNFGKPVQDCMYAQELLVHNDVSVSSVLPAS